MIRFKRISGLHAKFAVRFAAIASAAAAASVVSAGVQPTPEAIRSGQPATLEVNPVSVPQPPARLDDLIADLSSPDFLARELATVRIRDDKSIRLAEIEKVLTTRDLPLEAHSRLITIARDRFTSSPRAAMGVQFDQATLRDRIVIEDTCAPFDCHRLLEPGDILIEADGVPLTSAAGRPMIQGLIISRDPGDTMNLVVRRGAEKLNLDVKLGDFRELRNNVLDEARLFRAWRTRSQDYTRKDDPVKTPVHVSAWPDAIQASRMLQVQQMRVQSTNPTMVVHAGGRARSSNLMNDSSWYPSTVRGANGIRMNVGQVNAQAMQLFLDFGEPSPQPPMSHLEEVESLARKRAQIAAQLDRARADAERAPAGSAEAIALELRVSRIEIGVRAVDRQLEALNAERRELGSGQPPSTAPGEPGDR